MRDDIGSAPTTPDDVSSSTSHDQQFLDLLDAGINSQQKSGNLDTDADGETFRAVSSATNANMLSSEKSPNDPADGEEESEKTKRTEKSSTSHRRFRELAQDESTDCAPFRFKPYQLAHMLDSKDLWTLAALGGTDGIIHGLGTHSEHGLTTKSFHTGRKGPQDADQDASYSHNSKKHDLEVGGNILSTEPSGEGGVPSEEEDNAPYNGTMDDRKRVYGENFPPIRTSKTLLQLMAISLMDMVLSLPVSAAVISLALSGFQKFGIPRHNDKPSVDWDVVAILIATFVVVVDGNLNDWQKECQFKKLNERKEEREVKVVRDGTEVVVDIKEVVVGDIALVEPGEIIPCDGIFISGHNVKCDESGTTGESEAIKKVSYADLVKLTRIGSSSHADCFMISGSKVIEGVGKYVVIAVGTKRLRTDNEFYLKWSVLSLPDFIAKIGMATLINFGALMFLFVINCVTARPELAAIQNVAFISVALWRIQDIGTPWQQSIVVFAFAVAVAELFDSGRKRQSKGLSERKREHGIKVIGDDVERVEESSLLLVTPIQESVKGNTTLPPETIPCCSDVEIVSQEKPKRKRRKRAKKPNDSSPDKDDVSEKVFTYLHRILLAKEDRNAASEHKAEASDSTFARVSAAPPASSIRGTLPTMLLNPAFDTGPDMSITQFCENYGLRPEIYSKLEENGYDNARNFRFVTLDNLTEMGFTFGERAVLQDAVERWAVRRP